MGSGRVRSEHGADPRHQFENGERLDDIVVDAGAEAADPLRLLDARGHHDNRKLAGPVAAANPLAKLEARNAGQRPVEDDEVGWIFGEDRFGLVAAPDGFDAIALRREIAGDRRGDARRRHRRRARVERSRRAGGRARRALGRLSHRLALRFVSPYSIALIDYNEMKSLASPNGRPPESARRSVTDACLRPASLDEKNGRPEGRPGSAGGNSQGRRRLKPPADRLTGRPRRAGRSRDRRARPRRRRAGRSSP